MKFKHKEPPAYTNQYAEKEINVAKSVIVATGEVCEVNFLLDKSM